MGSSSSNTSCRGNLKADYEGTRRRSGLKFVSEKRRTDGASWCNRLPSHLIAPSDATVSLHLTPCATKGRGTSNAMIRSTRNIAMSQFWSRVCWCAVLLFQRKQRVPDNDSVDADVYQICSWS